MTHHLHVVCEQRGGFFTLVVRRAIGNASENGIQVIFGGGWHPIGRNGQQIAAGSSVSDGHNEVIAHICNICNPVG